MKVSSLTSFSLLGVVSAGINGGKPNGPTYAGTNRDCTWYLDLVDDSYTCENIESQWDLSHEVFVAWNPGVKKDCSGLKVGLSVCVEAPMESVTTSSISEASTSLGTSTASPTASGPPLPSPTQDGLVGNCTKFHRAVSGDTYGKIISRYKPITLDQFIGWNPAVEKDCSGLWSGYHYCVGIPGIPSAPPTSISASTLRSSTSSHATVKPAAPGPTQDGIIKNCQRWHKAVSGNTCASLLKQYGTFTQEEFIKWNPAVGEDCSGLWLNYYYCIGIPGTPTTKKSVPKPTPTGCNSPGLPSPTQPGAICQCSKWHQVRQGDTCDNITRKYRISISKFKEWNPNVGKDCYGLWLRYYVCVGGK
ncbi:LysM domain-containing protein [Trichophyton equinum CBS 127.97]|uniref:LysM domain-containing protein n=1 Tax=Trichophyton equinum (strain ATCC MYA-4606 / CBS 127.97) TaxID=559882 RepID=F2PH36_TRIEC|nr:LysM domain-containing protein [Trichophyton equinum CBS 127.97]